MEAVLTPLLNVDQFLDWADGREGKFELEAGRVLAMAPERFLHARVKSQIFFSLAHVVSAAGLPCEVFTDSIAVRIDRTTSYVPDVLVHCGDRLGGKERETRSAVIVVEVLSPSTAYRDASAKLDGYFRIATVHHYLIVDGDRRLIIHHQRGKSDNIATRIAARGMLTLDPPGLTLDVDDLLPPIEVDAS